MQNRTDPSSDEHKEAIHSSAEDSQVELFTSSPCKTQHSGLSQKKAATKLAASTELGSPVAPRKSLKHKGSSGVKDSDSTDVTPRKPHKHKKSSGMEDSDTTDVTPGKPRKHKRSSGMEDSDSIDVTPRKPHKHKKSSGMEDSDTTNVTPGKPRKHKRSSGMEDSDSTDVTPRKPHKHKKSSGVEDSDTTDVTPRKPRRHKKPSGTKGSDHTDVTPRKPRKHKESSGMEDSDGSSVGFEETAKSVTDHDQIKNKSQGKLFPSEDSSELPEILKDVGKLSSMGSPASQASFVEENEFLDASELVLPDLDTATQELGEFIPHVRNLSASAIRQLATRDLVRFRNFKQKGIAVKFGKFTKKENDQLRKNVEAFLKESGIESAEKLLFTHRFPEERAAIRKLKAEHFFGIRIAEGIPRPWRLVYYRARKIFDPNNNSGRYSDQEKRKLLEYQAIYGNNWKKISELMSRTSHSVALKYSQIKSKPKTGPWSKEETKRLLQAVEETLQENCKEFDSGPEEEEEDKCKALSVERENLYKGISWVEVEAKVGTRHWRQCKQKWMSIVTKRMSGGRVIAGRAQSLQLKINLIERLYELNIEDANDVDWEVLSSIIGDVWERMALSLGGYYVQRRFYKLKATRVPCWNRKTFPEIIDHLHEVTLPKLKALLKSKRAGGAARAQATPVKKQRKVFQLQDIFQESSDELIDDSEDELQAEGGAGGSGELLTGRKEGQSGGPERK
ncbi:PREDICTED: transcription termination factor 1 [Gekko japonicus]|uniref:Transcription termination factor 1 n=1 Tax=Gekko japonicus TaxID=146911 RepID=A0ABM1JNI3_GEKJA|nr:PREDICTED: transcription termination factor 1 [Gekko japonicus]